MSSVSLAWYNDSVSESSSAKFPSSFPFVSGKRDAQNAVIKCDKSMIAPICLKDKPPDTRYGLANPPILAIAFVAECPSRQNIS